MLIRPSLFRFDSSVGRGDFVTSIGVGQVIKGKVVSNQFHLVNGERHSGGSYDHRLG